jgi:hypothetical protein
MIKGELKLGLDGALDSLLLGSSKFYQADYTRPLLFISGSEALNKLASSYNLQGDQWGL